MAEPSKQKPGGARRELAWEELDASSLETKAREKLGRVWAHRREQEHLAVGAFALLTHELAQIGAPDVVLGLVTRAASDEVRHAEICRRCAVAYLGPAAVAPSVRGTPEVPRHAGVSAEDRALFHVVEMCCLSETITGVYFTEMANRATHPVAHEIVQSLLEDEIDHGRVGWAYLASRRGDASAKSLAAALPAMLDRTFGRFLAGAAAERESDDPRVEAFGYLGNDCGRDVYLRTLRDVVLPGFEEVGVDLSIASKHLASVAWSR